MMLWQLIGSIEFTFSYKNEREEEGDDSFISKNAKVEEETCFSSKRINGEIAALPFMMN